MSRTCAWLLCAAVAAASGAQAQTATPFDWRPINYQTFVMLRVGRYADAAPVIDRALQSCPQAATPLEAGLCTAIFQENRSLVLEHAGDPAGAEAALQLCLAARSAVLPVNHPLIGEAQYFLATFYQRQGRRAEELAALAQMEVITRLGGPAKTPELIGVLTRHGLALGALGRQPEAVPVLQEARSLALQDAGPLSRNAQVALQNLAEALVAAGSPDAAFDLVQAELSRPGADAFDPVVRARLAGLLGLQARGAAQLAAARPIVMAAAASLEAGTLTEPNVSYTLLCSLSRVLAASRDGDAALAAVQRARALAARAWGPRSYQVMQALRTEAATETARGNPAAAATRLREAIDLADTPALVLSRAELVQELATTLADAGQHGLAIAALMDMLSSPGVATDPNRPATLALLGRALTGLGEFEASARACTEALHLLDAMPRVARDRVVGALLCAGDTLLVQERPEAALQAGLRAQALLWAGMDPAAGREPVLRTQRQVLGLLLLASREAGQLAPALAYALQQLAVDQRVGFPDDIAASWAQVGGVQRRMGQVESALASYDAGLAALPPEGHAGSRADLLNGQGLVRLARHQAVDAISLFTLALELRRTLPSTDAFLLAEADSNLAYALAEAGQPVTAGQRLDSAIARYRGMGASRQGYLVRALLRRGTLAREAGDPAGAEAALREALLLQSNGAPDGPDGAGTRLELARLLDDLARRDEAAALRQQALATLAARYGADSAIIRRARLASPPAASVGAPDTGPGGCAARAGEAPDLRLACLLAETRAALAAGRIADAGALAARAVAEAETRWGADSDSVTEALLLRAEAAAAAGDAGTARQVLTRAGRLAGSDPASTAWLGVARGRLLALAGDPAGAAAALRQALAAGTALRDPGLLAAATAGLAAQLVASGDGEGAIVLWNQAMPQLAAAPLRQVAAWEGLGDAAASLGRTADAARFYGEASALSRRAEGAGTTRFRRLVAAHAAALSRAGDRDAAGQALAGLKADPSPAAALARLATLSRLAEEAGDPAAALVHARQAAQLAASAFGAGSVVAGYVQLDLAAAQVLAGEHPEGPEAAIAVIREQDPGWRAARLVARVRGLVAAQAGRFDEADAAFADSEALVAAHAGPGSPDAAVERANRAASRLARGDVAGADSLYRTALEMAAPRGASRTPVWARIAVGAAASARRLGDAARADTLMQDARRILPATQEVRQRWL